MPIDLPILTRQIEPSETVLLFGAGSSIPSGGMSGPQMAERIAENFALGYDASLTLSDVATIVERRYSRSDLIAFVRSILANLSPTGSLLNLPLFSWKSIYTTNYDRLIEAVYERSRKRLVVYRSNFDFTLKGHDSTVRLFKLHGSIEEDVVDGKNSRIIISTRDFDVSSPYRELLYDSFRLDISSSHLLIIGHSLSDYDLKAVVDEALRRKREAGAGGKIFLLSYVRSEERAIIYEERGIEVCFASLDAFFAEIDAKLPPTQMVLSISDDPFDATPGLRPTTVDVSHVMNSADASVLRMYNGRAATYADIAAGFTFARDVANRMEAEFAAGQRRVVYLLGAAGVGKSTVSRQVLIRLLDRGMRCWEHKADFSLEVDEWAKVATELKRRNSRGVLLVDDCHWHLREVNNLLDRLGREESSHLRILLVSTKHHWSPRSKSPIIFSQGVRYELSRLTPNEIDSLLDLLERVPQIRSLVEDRFLGFSHAERRRRLLDRCGADMFVCLKNIFGFERIDEIILKEYAELSEGYQDIYRTVAAMEAAGVRVHRQLIIRTLGIEASAIASILENLADIITEYTINEKHGLYGWMGRHEVVVTTLTKYKYASQEESYGLFETIVANLNPTYDIEVRTIRDMCDLKSGIGKITDRAKQNYLLRRMISVAPGERVPRHRLIWNLIEISEFEEAEREIRIFEKELRTDSPLLRYKVRLALRRAERTKGIMNEDRAAIVREAAALAEQAIRMFGNDKSVYQTFCEVGIAFLRLTGNWEIFDAAMSKAKEAEGTLLDPDLRRIISTFEGLAHRIQRGAS